MRFTRRTTGAVTALAASALAVSAIAAAAPTSTPSVKFVSPKAGTTIRPKGTFVVKLTNFKINAAAVGKNSIAGQGHLHFSMDKGKYDYPKYSGANGQLAVKLGTQGKYSPAVTPSITYRNLPQGKHTLVVFLVNNDHSNTSAKASTSFTVK